MTIQIICIKADIPKEICAIDDELKAIYHSKDSICIWLFKTQKERNSFMKATSGMLKTQREEHYIKFHGENRAEK